MAETAAADLIVRILIAVAGGMISAVVTALILVGKFNTRLAVAENQIAMITELSSEVKDLSKSVGEVVGRVGVLESEQKHTRVAVHDLRNDVNGMQLKRVV